MSGRFPCAQLFVIFTSPGVDSLAGVAHRNKPVLVQAFIPKLAIEAFNIRILNGFAGTDKGKMDTASIRPFIEYLTRTFRPVIDGNRQRQSPQIPQSLQLGNSPSRQRRVDFLVFGFPRPTPRNSPAAMPLKRRSSSMKAIDPFGPSTAPSTSL
jgi:hypothetical protein